MIRIAVLENESDDMVDLEFLLSEVPDIDVVYIGQPLRGTLQTLIEVRPDILLFEIISLNSTIIGYIKKLKKSLPLSQIIVITALEDSNSVISLLKAGASGYLLKSDSKCKVLNAIYTSFEGESPLNGKIARRILDHMLLNESKFSLDEFDLTRREKEIALLLLNGLQYKDICAQCHISMDTAFTHARKIFEKLRVNSRAELAARFNQAEKIT